MLSTRHSKRTPRRPQAAPATHIQNHAPPIKGRNIKANIGEGNSPQQKSCKRKIEHIEIPKIVNNTPSNGTRAPFTSDIPGFILFKLMTGLALEKIVCKAP
jgi:hypothetical protein